MQKNKLKEVIFAILEIDIENSQIRNFQFETKFEKKYLNLKERKHLMFLLKLLKS